MDEIEDQEKAKGEMQILRSLKRGPESAAIDQRNN